MSDQIIRLLTEQAEAQRALADQYAQQLDGVTDLDILEQAERKLTARLEALQRQVEELQHQLEDVQRRRTLADRYRVAREVADWLTAQARHLEPSPAADAIAATGLPVQPQRPTDAPPEHEMPFNVVDAPPERARLVSEITGGLPVVPPDVPDTPPSPAEITAVDPVPAPAGPAPAAPAPADTGPKHARPRRKRRKSNEETDG